MLSYRCTTEFPVRAGEVQFGLLSSDETRQMSTVQIKDTTIYYRGLPNPYGINDHRMGTVDRRLLCGTCGRDVKECQGHVGHIELAYPMYHIGFFDMCFKTLRCVCFTCSRILLTDDEVRGLGEDEGKTRFQGVYNSVKTRKKCSHCGMVQPTYTRLSLTIKCEFSSDIEWETEEEKAYCTAPFTQRDALSILTHITESDAKTMGFNEFCKPRDLIMLTVLVPPPVARPAIMASEGSRSRGQDDLTHKLQDINKRSIELQAYMGDETWRSIVVTSELNERIAKLQFEVFTYMNNNIRGQKQSTQRSGQPTKSITDRLRGKDGRIRGNLMGKRVDFSARSVITPDAVMDIDQVGIPYKVAMSLTVPERVTSYNIEELTRRISNGPTHIFGAETVITSNGVMINLAHCENRDKIRLQFGWIVERFLCDGDVVIFNRQPSLHKVGMMGHRVKLMPGNTFRLNLCCANPYNADFDGDEMNLHVPQSYAAIADVASIMMVSRQIISPQANRPVMAIVQDSLLGAHLFSSIDTFMTRQEACHILAHVRYASHELPLPCVSKPIERWTGKQLLSLILPNTLNIANSPASDDLHDHDRVIVRQGHIISGVLKKAMLGTSAGGFVDVLYRQFGSSITINWMADIQRMVNSWLCLYGFCVGVKDCVLSEKGEKRVKDRVTTAMGYAQELVNEPVAKGTDESNVLEGTVVRILSKCLMHTGGIVDEELGEDNAIRKMVQSGSKGNPINLSQICGCVGQQSVEGRRVFAEKGGRTLSCFEKNDNTLAGQGFVQNSYALGLHPHEYFFHAMGGREGLVDTAVKTATTGYIQRRQMKSMEDMKVCYDGTVRNAEESIIDFSYGGDGMDATRVERVALKLLEHNEAKLKDRFVTDWEFELAIEYRELLLSCKMQKPIDSRILLPFSPHRLKIECLGTKGNDQRASRDELECIIRRAIEAHRSISIRAAILDCFNVGVLEKCRVSTSTAEALFKTLESYVNRARVSYGEMVGSVAAQSIGEPCTQMTLNSVDWHTTMAIHWTGTTPPPAPHDAEVGAFIDALIDERPADCQVQPDGKTIYLPLEPGTAVALSPDEDGRMVWTELEAVTRHPPINKDGSNTLVEVTTDSGRTVTVTKGKSLLVEREGKLVEVEGDDVAIGDRVPVVQELPPAEHQDTLDLHTVFRETEAVFTNTMIEAMEATQHDRHWFLNGGFKGRSCYNRSDTMRDAVRKRPALLVPDRAVWPYGGNFFPMRIPLDRDFGFFVGAYLAEGCVTDHQVHIANVDPAFRNAARVWPERHGIKSHETKEEHRHKNNGVSICVMFHSTILVELMVRTCGKLSAGKRVPGFAFAAPDNFVRGLLDGYISGDGCISNKQAMLTATSRSQKLRDGVALLLTRFGIGCRLTQRNVHLHVLWTTEEDGTITQTKYGDKTPIYELSVNAEGTRRFAEEVDLVLAYKEDRSTAILDETQAYKVSKRYATMRNVRLEEIVALNDAESSHEFVYDLTVAQTRNMTAANGLGCADTFHLSGVGNKSVTLGIPRLKELLDQAKSIKTPSNRIRFVGPLAKSSEFASYFAATLPLTRLGDIVASCDFVYDPDPRVTVVEADAFMVELNERVGIPVNADVSKYVVRLLLNQNVMKTRRITPPMVRRILRNRLHNKAHIISSETNSIEWTIRIRFEKMESMMKILDNKREREGLLCHRVVSVMLDTIALSGHIHVSNAHMTTEENNDGETTYVVDTQGCSLIDLSAASCIDWYNTTSNDINEIHQSLGLEAAVNVLYSELTATISFDGTYVDPRHIMMICNTMTRGGYIMPLSRHGINRMDTGPLLRCSFEETPDILCDAACFGECDNGRGVSQNIMTGKLPEIGTGAMHIRVSSRMMHPRDTLQQQPTRKRVLKSSVRRRNDQVHEAIEYREMERTMFYAPTEMDIEAPFETKTSSLRRTTDNIFASEACQAPYIEDDESATNRSEYAASSVTRKEYRPSSPMSDDCA